MENKTAQTNIIKNGSAIRPRRGLLKNQVIAARDESDAILNEARQAADAILRAAREEAEVLKERAYLEGKTSALTEFDSLLQTSHKIRAEALGKAERDLLLLSVGLAEKIIGCELATKKTAIVEIVSTALKNARQREEVTVRVNPLDVETINTERERFASDERIRVFEVAADPSVESGGCIIETEVGTIDARLDTQMEVLRRTLLNYFENENAE